MNQKNPPMLVSSPSLLTAGFFVLVLIQVWNHVMWRDELRPWQLIKECGNPVEVVRAMRFDAVPILWNMIIFVLTRFGDYPFLMQFTHTCIATGVVYVVARWAPFSNAQKVLFSLGYFPFFEYATIARNYSLVFLLIVIACAILSRERIHWIGLAVVTTLLTQVSIWGAALGGLLLAVGVAMAWMGPEENRPGLLKLAGIGGIFLLGMVLCFIEILPGPGPSFTEGWRDIPWDDRIFHSLGSIYRAWIPVPRLEMHFWNTNILESPFIKMDAVKLFPVAEGILAVLLFAACAGMMVGRPVALGWLLAATGVLVGFTMLRFRGAARHEGVLFIVLIAAWWLAQKVPAWEAARTQWLERYRSAFMSAILGIGAFAGVAAASIGMMYPFSATRAVAEYIRTEIKEPMTLLSFTDYASAPVSQWLDRSIFSVQEQRDIRINTQNDVQRIHYRTIDVPFILNTAYQLIQERKMPVLLLLNSTVQIVHQEPLIYLPGSPMQQPRGIYLIDITDRPELQESIVRDEGHRLYIVRSAG